MINFRIGDFSVLPFDKLVIESDLDIVEASATLYDKVDFRSSFELIFKSKVNGKEFQGKVNNYRFNIKRIINYKNSFLPVISGKIEKRTYPIKGSQISVMMRMNWLVMIFSLFWIGTLFLFICNQIVNLIYGEEINKASLIPMFMFFLGFLLINGGFSHEASKARKLLINIFEGEELK